LIPTLDVTAGIANAACVRVALQPLQVGAHVGGVLIAKIAILLQSFVNDLFKLGWQVRV